MEHIYRKFIYLNYLKHSNLVRGGGLMLFLSVFVRFCPFDFVRFQKIGYRTDKNGQKRTKIVTFHLNCIHNL